MILFQSPRYLGQRLRQLRDTDTDIACPEMHELNRADGALLYNLHIGLVLEEQGDIYNKYYISYIYRAILYTIAHTHSIIHGMEIINNHNYTRSYLRYYNFIVGGAG